MSLLSIQLEAFFAVYEELSVLRASERLNVVPTAITQRIRNLESDLNVTLFLRSKKGMTLTAEGQTLLKYCLNAREMESRTLSELKHFGKDVELELRIAGPTSFMSGRAAPALTSVLKKWPGLTLHFNIDDRENRLDLLKDGQADLVVLYPHQVKAELDSKRLKPDEYLLVACPQWKKRDLMDIIRTERLYAFHESDHTSLNYLKEFHLIKYMTRPRLFANENQALTVLLKAGVGYGILSREIATPFLEAKELVSLNDGKTMKDALALAWYPRAHMNEPFKDILNALR